MPEARAAALRALLNEHSHRYHVLHAPVITDAEYDALFRELAELERAHPELAAPDSPTQRVGSDLARGFAKVPHAEPVLSLANAFGAEDLRAWDSRNRRLVPGAVFAYTVEPKFDGLTLVLRYEDGVLVRAATRGNGETGDDVTANARTIRTLPLRIPVSEGPKPPSVLIVRGEVLFMKPAFEALNRARKEDGEPEYVSARNTASGSLKQKDARLTAQRDLTAFVYDIMGPADAWPRSRFERMQWLSRAGFNVAPDCVRVSDLNAVIDRIAWWRTRRDTLPYEIDGIVVKLDHVDLHDQLGVAGKDPRGSVAYKFPSEEMTTILESVEHQVGRTGRITPTANLKPVFVGGVTVSNATLHNYDQVASLDIRVGDTVIVKRSGDVIPYVVGPVTANRAGNEQPIEPPKTCAASGDRLVRRDSGVDLYCPNPDCPERIFRRVIFFASKEGMNMDGVGPNTLRTLIDTGLIADEADLFTLEAGPLLELDGFADRKTAELLASVNRARSRPATQLLTSLGIPGVGSVAARLLLQACPSLESLVAIASAVRDQEAQAAEWLPSDGPSALRRILMASHRKDPVGAVAAAIDPENAQLEHALRAVFEHVRPILDIEGIGPVLVYTLVEWFADPRNVELVGKLKTAGLSMESAPVQARGTALRERTFVITGTLPGVSRSQAKALIEEHGGKVTASVSKRTHYLLAGDKAGSKLTKAEKLGVAVLDLDALRRMIKDPGP